MAIAGGARRAALGDDLPCVNLERAEQRLCSVSLVLELGAASPAWRGWAIGKAPFERLHPRFLVDG